MTTTQRPAVNNPQQSQRDETSAAAESFGSSLMSPVGPFKANVSHCKQELAIIRTRDLSCHRVCMLRGCIALAHNVHVAVQLAVRKDVHVHKNCTPEH